MWLKLTVRSPQRLALSSGLECQAQELGCWPEGITEPWKGFELNSIWSDLCFRKITLTAVWRMGPKQVDIIIIYVREEGGKIEDQCNIEGRTDSGDT